MSLAGAIERRLKYQDPLQSLAWELTSSKFSADVRAIVVGRRSLTQEAPSAFALMCVHENVVSTKEWSEKFPAFSADLMKQFPELDVVEDRKTLFFRIIKHHYQRARAAGFIDMLWSCFPVLTAIRKHINDETDKVIKAIAAISSEDQQRVKAFCFSGSLPYALPALVNDFTFMSQCSICADRFRMMSASTVFQIQREKVDMISLSPREMRDEFVNLLCRGLSENRQYLLLAEWLAPYFVKSGDTQRFDIFGKKVAQQFALAMEAYGALQPAFNVYKDLGSPRADHIEDLLKNKKAYWEHFESLSPNSAQTSNHILTCMLGRTLITVARVIDSQSREPQWILCPKDTEHPLRSRGEPFELKIPKGSCPLAIFTLSADRVGLIVSPDEKLSQQYYEERIDEDLPSSPMSPLPTPTLYSCHVPQKLIEPFSLSPGEQCPPMGAARVVQHKNLVYVFVPGSLHVYLLDLDKRAWLKPIDHPFKTGGGKPEPAKKPDFNKFPFNTSRTLRIAYMIYYYVFVVVIMGFVRLLFSPPSKPVLPLFPRAHVIGDNHLGFAVLHPTRETNEQTKESSTVFGLSLYLGKSNNWQHRIRCENHTKVLARLSCATAFLRSGALICIAGQTSAPSPDDIIAQLTKGASGTGDNNNVVQFNWNQKTPTADIDLLWMDADPPAWSKPTIGGVALPPLLFASAVHDPVSDSLWVVGYNNDTVVGPTLFRLRNVSKLCPVGEKSLKTQQPASAQEINGDRRFCGGCGGQETTPLQFKKCSRCKAILYCSSECQKKHWPTHKADCKAPAAGEQDKKPEEKPNPSSSDTKATEQSKSEEKQSPSSVPAAAEAPEEVTKTKESPPAEKSTEAKKAD